MLCQLDEMSLKPFAVGMLVSETLFDLGVVEKATFCCVDRNHLPRPESPFFYDLGFVELDGTDF